MTEMGSADLEATASTLTRILQQPLQHVLFASETWVLGMDGIRITRATIVRKHMLLQKIRLCFKSRLETIRETIRTCPLICEASLF